MELKLLKAITKDKSLRIFFLIAIIFVWNINYSQDQPIQQPRIPASIAISTPDVMSFQKYGNIPVSLYNGKIDMVIPFYQIQSGKIDIPINLTYNSGGIKVDEIASQVGLGWNLNAGGSILRNINDLPDETLVVYNYGQGTVNPGVPVEVGFIRRWHFSNSYNWFSDIDSKPDFYYVNAPGLNNIFTIDSANYNNYHFSFINGSYIANFLYPKGHRLEPIAVENLGPLQFIGFTGDEDGNPTINQPIPSGTIPAYVGFKSFEIKNEQGLVYNFSYGNIIESRTLPILEAIIPNIEATAQDRSYSINLNTYNLNSIYDPSTKKIVTYTYETYQIPQAQKFRFFSKNSVGSNSCGYDYIPFYPNPNDDIYTNEKLIKYPRSTRLKKINFNEGEIEFIYLNNRQDYDDKSLDYIKIKDIKGNVIKSFHFIYSYFDSKEGCAQKECKRLKLDRIDEEYSTSTKMYYKFEYDYINKLPKRNSYEQDYLGYYNNNGYINPNPIGSFESGPQPKLYFYPNKGAFSILPFQKTNDTNGREITGDYSLAPNNYSLTGLLKKITYETGGFSEFEYENNSFNFSDAEYIAGGARIKKQKIDDNRGNVRVIEYTYKETDGTTSGSISRLPTFGYPSAQISNLTAAPNQWAPFNFTTYDFDKSGLDLTNGAFVGYSRIIEKEIGNGSTESLFNSHKDYPDIQPQRIHRDLCGKYLVDHSSFPSSLYENLDSRRGTLKQKIIRNESGNEISKTENIYTYEIFSSIFTKNYEPFKIPFNQFWTDLPRIDEHNAYVEEYSKINRERNLLTKSTTTEYLISGNKVTEQFFTYDSNYPFIKEQRFVDATSQLKVNNFYPLDFPITDPFISSLTNQNRLSETIKQETRKDNVLISKNQTNFMDFGSGIILQKSLSTAKGGFPYEETTIIDSRDNNGNITQLHDQSGLNTVLIWGYNKTLIIAKIENLTYSQIQSYESNLQVLSNTGTETDLISSLNSLRNTFPNAMITTYTHKPLIGVSTITDPKGDVTYYNYDTFNRLQSIIDKQGNILQKFCYNYKNQQTNCDDVFKSIAKSGSFTRNNCPSGYSGSLVTYNVAAGIYESVVSQADADNKAQAEINLNGQNYANSNGTCTINNINEGSIYNNSNHTISAGTMIIRANGNVQCSIAMPALAPGQTFKFSTSYSTPIFSNGTFVLELYSPSTGITNSNYINMTSGSMSNNGYFTNMGWGWKATVTSSGPQYTLNINIK